jgi:hypothetical protein
MLNKITLPFCEGMTNLLSFFFGFSWLAVEGESGVMDWLRSMNWAALAASDGAGWRSLVMLASGAA